MPQTTEENVADVLLGILHRHQGEWVSDAVLCKELASKRLDSLQKAALERLAQNGRIYMRVVEWGATSGVRYEYKAW